MMMNITFEKLKPLFHWVPIRNCPGRFVLDIDDQNLSMPDILECEMEIKQFQTAKARDMVLAAVLQDGGIISYKRKNGTYLHTLNTLEGFKRKLHDLGINNVS